MRLRVALAVLLVALLAFSSVSWTGLARGATNADGNQGNPAIAGDLIAIDQSGNQVSGEALDAVVDAANRSVTISAFDAGLRPFTVLMRQQWLSSLTIGDPSFSSAVVPRTYAGAKWYSAEVKKPTEGLALTVRQFTPEVGKAWYSTGSSNSILLERPMFISIVETPHLEFKQVTMSNSNGTWTEERPMSVNRLGISFTDADTSGQRIVLNRSWLAGYGIGDAFFQYSDGIPIANTSDASSYYLSAPHFSILYAFTVGDGFMKESDQPYSDVHWASSSRNVYVLSDRRDPANTNERLSSPSTGTYDPTTSFTIRGTWKTSQQGNWQSAIPLYFMSSSNSHVEMANSMYVLYYSLDSNLGQMPYYYLYYRDSTGGVQMSLSTPYYANVQVEFMFLYNAVTRNMKMSMYDAMGVEQATIERTVNPSESFTFNKIGAASSSITNPHTDEPKTIATADSLFLDANMARNGNFEVDSNSDGIPDYWQGWIWTKGPVYRSTDRAKFGSWSVKIPDSNSGLDYGLQTDRIAVGAGASYVGSSWVYSVSGTFSICMEAWNSQTYGTRLGVTCVNTATTGTWEYLETYMAGPSSGTNYIDLLLYSTSGNTGTGYFDGGEIHIRRSFWAFNVHNGEPATGGTWSGWQTAIDKAADMGASYIRSDFPWSTFEPNADGQWDETYVNHWKDVLNIAKTRGIGFIMNLKGPTPSWAHAWDPDVSGKFGEFCRGIGQRFNGMIPYFQILNEINVRGGDVDPIDSVWAAINACYSGLLTGMGISSTSHKAYFHTIVNIFVTINWEGNMRAWLDHASGSIDTVGIDFYPETDNFNNACNDWGVLNGLFSIMNDYGKTGAIMETGFANRGYLGDWRDDNRQVQWIDCALPVVQSYIVGRNTQTQSRPMLLANWYELYDHNTGSGNPQDTYGLIHSDLTEKPGCTDVRNRIPSWPW